LVLEMAKKHLHFKRAFTLIEVMVAVMIISVVIMALLKMYSNNAHIFSLIKQEIKTNQYVSLLIGNDAYGFEKKHIVMYDLVKDFDVENDLRRKLKSLKTDIIYTEVDSIDLSEDTGEEEGGESQSSSSVVLEIGRDTLKTKNFTTAIMRLRIK